MALISKKTQETGGQSKNWYRDRYESVLTQRNFLGIIALSSLILALVAGCIVLLLVQSKSVMPFLIQVDEKTGLTQVVDQRSQEQLTADEALRKYFIVKFIRAREGYDSNDIDVNSNVVRLLAVPSLYKAYWSEVINPQNKTSLYVTFANTKVRQVQIKAVQIFSDSLRANVRFKVIEREKQNPSKYSESHYIALLKFEFINLDLNMDDLMVNPLGFRVLEYKVDTDTAL